MRPKRPFYIPVLQGAAWLGQAGDNVANYLARELAKRPEIETERIDIRPLILSDRAEPALEDPRLAWSLLRADALIVLIPEVRQGYAERLKRALNLTAPESVRKAVGICGLAADEFDGTRTIPDLLPGLRELGLVPALRDAHFSRIRKLFDAAGELQDPLCALQANRFLDELIWMTQILRYGRDHLGQATPSRPSVAKHRIASRGRETHADTGRTKTARIARTPIALEAVGALS